MWKSIILRFKTDNKRIWRCTILLYHGKSQQDVLHNNAVGDVNIRRFAMNGDKHGQTVRTICYPYLLTMDKNKLNKLQEKYNGTDDV